MNPIQFYEFGKGRYKPFVTTWKTDNLSTGSTANNQIKLPLLAGGTYNFVVSWGDGTSSVITNPNQAEVTHTYATIGTYEVSIKGALKGWTFAAIGDVLKIMTIKKWGCFRILNNNSGVFRGCANLTATAVEDTLTLTGVTNGIINFFHSCTALTTVNRINEWDLSSVTQINQVFFNAINFNQDISAWNTANVFDMTNTFYGAATFNQKISTWNTVNVTSMFGMFFNATNFNWNIGDWNTINVTNMAQMFQSATNFNQNIGNWNTSKATTMFAMFYRATNFNQNIGNWNVSNVTNMNLMFFLASNFNQNIGAWNVSNVVNLVDFMANKTALNYSATNLDAIYNGWGSRPVKPNLTISFGTIKYTNASSANKSILIGTPNNMVITDGGI